jgi:hypothetical protein
MYQEVDPVPALFDRRGEGGRGERESGRVGEWEGAILDFGFWIGDLKTEKQGGCCWKEQLLFGKGAIEHRLNGELGQISAAWMSAIEIRSGKVHHSQLESRAASKPFIVPEPCLNFEPVDW